MEGDRTPLLTVTNFSDTTERIDIWATRDAGSKILKTLELPAKASVHINMRQEFTQRGAEFDALKAQSFGGFFIQAQNPTARVLVKEHIFSQSRQVASPCYGSVDIITSHQIPSDPNPRTLHEVFLLPSGSPSFQARNAVSSKKSAAQSASTERSQRRSDPAAVLGCACSLSASQRPRAAPKWRQSAHRGPNASGLGDRL